MTTQTPRPGEIWRHYKGEKHCSVLGVSTPAHASGVRAQNLGLLFFAVRVGTEITVGVYGSVFKSNSAEWRHIPAKYQSEPVNDEPLVSYACSGGLWVRPVAEFREKFSLVVFEAPR
jgi:hypothetical protein